MNTHHVAVRNLCLKVVSDCPVIDILEHLAVAEDSLEESGIEMTFVGHPLHKDFTTTALFASLRKDPTSWAAKEDARAALRTLSRLFWNGE